MFVAHKIAHTCCVYETCVRFKWSRSMVLLDSRLIDYTYVKSIIRMFEWSSLRLINQSRFEGFFFCTSRNFCQQPLFLKSNTTFKLKNSYFNKYGGIADFFFVCYFVRSITVAKMYYSSIKTMKRGSLQMIVFFSIYLKNRRTGDCLSNYLKLRNFYQNRIHTAK